MSEAKPKSTGIAIVVGAVAVIGAGVFLASVVGKSKEAALTSDVVSLEYVKAMSKQDTKFMAAKAGVVDKTQAKIDAAKMKSLLDWYNKTIQGCTVGEPEQEGATTMLTIVNQELTCPSGTATLAILCEAQGKEGVACHGPHAMLLAGLTAKYAAAAGRDRVARALAMSTGMKAELPALKATGLTGIYSSESGETKFVTWEEFAQKFDAQYATLEARGVRRQARSAAVGGG